MRLLAATAALLGLAACATPVRYGDGPMSEYDKNTKFSVTERTDGFTLSLYYSRYQFVPESDAVAAACRSQATALAWEQARARGRTIKPINDQEVRISMGRNGLSGITSCTASVPAYFE